MPSDRALPHDQDAEESVVGALMLSPDLISDVSEVVRPDDFYFDDCRTVYRSILSLYAKGGKVDPVTVRDELRSTGGFDKDPGLFLHHLQEAVPTPGSAPHYARIVLGHARRRGLLEASRKIAELAWGDGAADDVVRRAEELVFAAARREEHSPATEIADAVWDVLSSIDEPDRRGFPTEFRELDRILGGLSPGQLVLVAARPGVGKSSLVINIASRVARSGKSVALFSLEMSTIEVVTRMLCAEARVPWTKARGGALGEADEFALTTAAGHFQNGALWIVDSPATTIVDIRAQARRFKHRKGLDLVVVDYLQLMSSPTRGENRQQEIAEISRGLKMLAKELEVPVLACSQLNRAPEHRKERRPLLSDLRESGSLEQDADVVIFVDREQDGARAAQGVAELHVAKHRNGPTGGFRLTFLAELMAFADHAEER